MAAVLAFLVAGSLGTWVSWRYPFGLLVVLAGCVLILSKKLQPVARQPDVRIDGIGVVLAALAISLVSIGFNNVHRWGLLLAAPAAPVAPVGVSPALVMIVVGVVLGQAFFAWSKKRVAVQKTSLIPL